MRTRLLLPILAVLVALVDPAPARGQESAGQARLEGVVVSAEDGRPLPGVLVTVVELGRSARTGPLGRYAFAGVPRGTYTVTYRRPGRLDGSLTVSVASGVQRGDVALTEAELFVMEEIQATATRTQRESFEVPQPVNVIDRRELERNLADHPIELFVAQPGLEVEGAGPFLGLPVIRGLTGNRVLVLVDGERLNNAREAINFGGVQPGLVDVGQIEEIEVTRGPGSVLYGSDAIGGIVNIVTKRPDLPERGVRLGGRAETRYSSADEQRTLRLAFHAAGPRLGLLVRGGLRDARSYEAPGGTVPNSGAETHDVETTLTWRPATAHRFELDVERFRGSEIGVPGTGGVFTGSFPFTERTKAAVRYDGTKPLPGVARLEASAWIQDQEENFATVLDLPPVPAGPFELLIDTDTERVSDVRTTGFDLDLQSPLGSAQLVSYGVQVFRDEVDEERREVSTVTRVPTAPGPPGGTETTTDTAPTTPRSTFGGLGAYVQDEIVVGRLTAIPGMRYDRFSIEAEPLERPEGGFPGEDRVEEALSGSLGLLLRATDEVHLTATVGRAFRTPNVIERYFFGPGSQGGLSVPNPDLENETSLNVDAGVKVRGRRFAGSVTYFRNRIDDFITFVPGTFMGEPEFGGQPVSTVDNVGEALVQGVEAEAEVRGRVPGGTGGLVLAFSTTHGENLEDDTPLFVPPAKAVVGLNWTSDAERVAGAVRARFVDGQRRVPEGFDPTSGFTVVDLHAALDLAPWLGRDADLRVGVRNVADRAYSEPLNAAPAPGRSLVVSLDAAVETFLRR